ncbi:MAG: hypothetical protein FJX63_04785 [Alphaproteobacteria bacterium]|nr:hypothetical protein [Alphaproteobacteria bacterium]
MKQFVKSGAVLAAAALSFAVSGATIQTAQADDGRVMCMGVNSCKGQSACKTATNSCGGMNSCKGQGWLNMTAAECASAGGKSGGGLNG